MAQSFTPADTGPLAAPEVSLRRTVLVTGASGNIGSYFASHAHKKYQLRLLVRPDEKPDKIDPIRRFGEVISANIGDLDAMKRACDRIDTVLHLAADPSPSAVWSSVLSNNIVGSYNTLVAAKAAGCRRVVYASSIHAVSGYPADVQVKTTDPVNPGDLYGVSKCFTEALCRYMAEQEGLSCIAVRIGAFQPDEAAESEGALSMLDAWVSQRDLQQLLERCIDVGELRFAIFHGLSDNRFKRLDISDARELLGYKPIDDLTAVNPKLKNLHLAQTLAAHSVADDRQKSGLRNELTPSPKSNPDTLPTPPNTPTAPAIGV
jgi:nucleoside-diphosphate-sugar epimerase